MTNFEIKTMAKIKKTLPIVKDKIVTGVGGRPTNRPSPSKPKVKK